MKVELTLKGKIPSKKNSRRPFIRGKRVMNFPSADYVAWHKDASLQLLNYRYRIRETIEQCRVTITLYAPDKRKSDLTNKAESVMDLLVDNGFIVDDNWFCVSSVTLIFGGVDTENPRAEIELDSI